MENDAPGKTEKGKRKRDQLEPEHNHKVLCLRHQRMHDKVFAPPCECPPICSLCLFKHYVVDEDDCDMCRTPLRWAKPHELQPPPAQVEPPPPAQAELPPPAQAEPPPAAIEYPVGSSADTSILLPSVRPIDVRLEDLYHSSDSSVKDYQTTLKSTEDESNGSGGSM